MELTLSTPTYEEVRRPFQLLLAFGLNGFSVVESKNLLLLQVAMFAIEEPVSALAVSPITSEDEVSAAVCKLILTAAIFVLLHLCFVFASKISPPLSGWSHDARARSPSAPTVVAFTCCSCSCRASGSTALLQALRSSDCS